MNARVMTLVVLASATVTLASCTMMMGSDERIEPAPTGDARFCLTYEPIAWSVNDTPETIRGVKRENAKWLELCRVAVKP